MIVHGYFLSSAAHRLRIALNLKGIAAEPRSVHLRKREQDAEAYRAVNPQGLVPALEADDGTVLTQSLAIIEFLDETCPQPRLIPEDALGRARVRALSLIVACEIHPLNNARTLAHLRKAMNQTEDQVNAWYRHWVADGLAKFEASLASFPGTGRFCHGDAPTMADCCLVPQVFNAQRFDCDTKPYPTVMRVFDECMKLEAFDRAQPAKQPDAEP